MKTIRDIMTPDPIKIQPETPLRRAVELLIENNISGLPVVDADDKIVGVLGDWDLVKIFYLTGVQTVRTVMTHNPTTISIDEPLVEVFDYLMSHDFRRVLIHENGKLVGLVSRADLMPPLLDALLERT
jgi:CBS domain-containing protein